ncbi:DUF3862 domain-containing protein [Streptococcus ferus]|uniref:DUF3862 domain-containing protein n=1 Tax=Streptococcus ferus TaxID=1345 RepID=UPI002352F183|nr:DUF3862 domain-containing protein [Streptococcus ferus]
MNKRKLMATVFIIGLIIVMLTIFLINTVKMNKTSDLTLTDIHDKVVLGKTSRQDIKKLFGNPKSIEQNVDNIRKTYEKWTQDETGINFSLSDGTDYWESIKYIDDGASFSEDDFTICYQYQADSLGVKAVYFFFIDNRLEAFVFDDTLTHKSVAKKDKYLRQIID